MNISGEELLNYCQANGIMVHVNTESEYDEAMRFLAKYYPNKRGTTFDPFKPEYPYIVFSMLPSIFFGNEDSITYRQHHGFTDQIIDWNEFKTQFDVTAKDCAVVITVDRINVYKLFCQMIPKDQIKVVQQYYLEKGFYVVDSMQTQQ